MAQLDGKRVLITGATTGIGFATAKLFQNEGARVVITGQNAERVASAASELGSDVIALQANVTSRSEMTGVMERVAQDLGGLDVVFANAGIAQGRPLGAMDDAHINELLDINIRGVIVTVEASLPLLANPASVILTSSTAASKAFANHSLYAATKAAVRSFARTFSAELAPRGVRVNALSPGLTDTPIIGKLGVPDDQRDAFLGQMVEQIPAKRVAQPEEMARAALYLASDASSYMVGGDLLVDGGNANF